jgi:hypothetical protein
MRKKCLSICLMVSTTLTFCHNIAFASVLREGKPPTEATGKGRAAVARDEKLKSTMLKLVADAKSESSRPAIHTHPQTPHSNNLSTGQKIAIGVGVVVAVVVVVGIIGWKTSRSQGVISIR